MFRVEFLKTVWDKGRVESVELAAILHTTVDMILAEAGICEEHGWVKVVDSIVFATPLTGHYQSAS
jgi:hypothetical protein